MNRRELLQYVLSLVVGISLARKWVPTEMVRGEVIPLVLDGAKPHVSDVFTKETLMAALEEIRNSPGKPDVFVVSAHSLNAWREFVKEDA